MNKYNKLNIYLRQFSRNRVNNDRPEYFNYESVFANFLATIKDYKDLINLTICFEKEEDYNSHFTKKYEGYGLFKIKFINTSSNKIDSFEDANWSRSVAITSRVMKNDNLPENELCMSLEDDYCFRPGWIEAVFDLFNNNFIDSENSYVCLYENFDKHLFKFKDRTDHWGMYYGLKSEIIVSNYSYWRELPNTGMSVICPVKTFNRDYDYTWRIGTSDCEACFRIKTKYDTKFWVSIPSFSSHLVNPFIAQLVDWSSYLRNVKLPRFNE